MDHEYEKFKRFIQIVQDTVYHEPETPNFHNKIIDSVINDIIKPLDLPTDSKILDVGCGSGYFMRAMRELGYDNTLGITLNDEDIAECNKDGLNTFKSDFTFINLPNDTADFIWCRHSLEHSVFPFFTLLEYNRLLKNGHQMYVEVPAERTDRRHEENGNHYSIMGNEMWANLFLKAGFDIEYIKQFVFDLTDDQNGTPVQQTERFYLCLLTKRVDMWVD